MYVEFSSIMQKTFLCKMSENWTFQHLQSFSLNTWKIGLQNSNKIDF